MSRPQPWLAIPTLALAGMSWLLASLGLASLVDVPIFGTAISLALTAGVILVFVVAYEQFSKSDRPIYKAGAGFFFVISFFWLTTFGYGAWWSMLAERQRLEANIELADRYIFSTAIDAISAARFAEDQVRSMAELAAKKIDLERLQGGTCGLPSQKGDGPAIRARQSYSIELANAAAVMRKLVETNNHEFERLREARTAWTRSAKSDSASLAERKDALARSGNSFISQINAESRNAQIAMVASLKSMQASVRLHPGQPEFQCQDIELGHGISRTLEAVGRIYELRSVPIDDSTGHHSSAAAIESLSARIYEYAEAAVAYIFSRGRTASQTASPPVKMIGREQIALAASLGLNLFTWFMLLSMRGPAHRSFPPDPTVHANKTTLSQIIYGRLKAAKGDGKQTEKTPPDTTLRVIQEPMPTPQDGVDVFVSYKRRNRPEIEGIAKALSALRVSVWFDARLDAGTPFQGEIARELKLARCVLVCWTPDALRSGGDVNGWVIAEAMAARSENKYVPLMLEPTRLDPPFNGDHVEDLSVIKNNPSINLNGVAVWARILDAIGKKIGRPALGNYIRIVASEDGDRLEQWIMDNSNDPLLDSAIALRLEMAKKKLMDRIRQ